MNRHSLNSRITFIFSFTFILICLLFLLLAKMQTRYNLENMQERQFQAINYLFQLYQNNTPPRDLEAFFRHFGLKQVENRNLMVSVLEDGEISFHRMTQLGSLSSIVYNSRFYLLVDGASVRILLENQSGKQANDFLWVGFALALVLLMSMYVSIIKSISPLKELSGSIRRFASGDMDVECKIDGKDEIAEVANEFDKAVKKIRDLIRSRQLFLRTIMHELKTPIGKGRIVSEMVESVVEKNRLVGIFERLDLLINEFSKIEQLVSRSYALEKKEYPLMLVVEQATDLLMLEEEQLYSRVNICLESNPLIVVDFGLMTLAIKNLLDNGLKYSDDKKVRLSFTKNMLCISSSSKPLEYPIEHYYEAFTTTASKGKKGMGLGLYIVKNILELHGFELRYRYKNGIHKFCIDFKMKEKKRKKRNSEI